MLGFIICIIVISAFSYWINFVMKHGWILRILSYIVFFSGFVALGSSTCIGDGEMGVVKSNEGILMVVVVSGCIFCSSLYYTIKLAKKENKKREEKAKSDK